MNHDNHQKIIPFLWFDGKAEEAINFYVSVFPDAEITVMKRWPETMTTNGERARQGTIHVGGFAIGGYQLYAFDAAPMAEFNPSISFFVVFETETEVNTAWSKLIEGGEELIPLNKYAWSDRYGWLTDRFGISWQLYKGKLEDVGLRVSPSLMFSGSQRGKAEEAAEHYMSVFQDAISNGMTRYGANEGGPEGMVKHGQFRILGQTFMVMDNENENDIPFNEAISFFVKCKGQQEVDYFWDQFTKEGEASMCGWLKDKFGVSWQIVPDFFMRGIETGTPEQTQNMMDALMQMKKPDVERLQQALNK